MSAQVRVMVDGASRRSKVWTRASSRAPSVQSDPPHLRARRALWFRVCMEKYAHALR